jgi:hypothetical protein
MRKLILLLLAISPAAWAQQGGGIEQLFLIPPPGWTILYHDMKGSIDLTEMLPPGQTLTNWTEMLSIEMIQGKPTMDVQTVLNLRLDAIHEGCDAVGAGPAQVAVENGYDVGIRAIACPKSKRYGKGELSLFKVILGRNRTYIVSRAWSGDPFEKDKVPVPAKTTEDWLAFMGKILVCDTAERSHPCPSK